MIYLHLIFQRHLRAVITFASQLSCQYLFKKYSIFFLSERQSFYIAFWILLSLSSLLFIFEYSRIGLVQSPLNVALSNIEFLLIILL